MEEADAEKESNSPKTNQANDSAPKYGRPRRTENRLLVENLAPEVSWQVPLTIHSFPSGGFSRLQTFPVAS